MPSDMQNSETQSSPMPKFRFEVDFGDQFKSKASFQEVSGLDKETQVIEYRHSNKPLFSTIKMPGIAKFGNITMKKGVMEHDESLANWLSEIKMNTIRRKTVTIRLLDETGNTAMEWQLINAWPTKIKGTDLKSNGNEFAIDTIEFAHEGLRINAS